MTGNTETGTGRTGYLGLGSNIGDRFGHLNVALEALADRGLEITGVSSAYETAPVGEILDQPDFLNAAARIDTGLEPEALLDQLKEIEAERGREAGGVRHAPRVLDIDLLLLGDLVMETPRLKLPHREVTSRRFVLVPLLELDPDLRLPGTGRSLAEALEALPAGQHDEVRRAGELRPP